MNYAGLGFRPTSTFQKPKQVFKPVFEQISTGEHPINSRNTNPAISWRQVRQHINLEENNADALSTKILLFVPLITIIASIISMAM